jgi:WD repeat-containing protein 19
VSFLPSPISSLPPPLDHSFYSLCGQYQRALKFFIQCGDREIDAAIEVVGKSQNEHLTHQLIDFLVGETDGIPKDPNYIYRLYMALKKYDDAAKTALIIARQEQDMGNYALAHSVVTETIRKLEDDGVRVPLQLRSLFVLLHSYLLAKRLAKKGDHQNAARMLLRVAENISKFPTSTVPILTSTVIECYRSGLKHSAYEYALVLMRPEHRSLIEPSIKRKIEGIVRRRVANNEDILEELSPCPISGQMIPASQLSCPTTRDALPMCIITGKHLALQDWTFCPNSKLPALHSEYVRYIQEDYNANQAKLRSAQGEEPEETTAATPVYSPLASSVDPILNLPVAVADLEKTTPAEALKYIQRYNNVKEEKDKQDKEQEGGDKKTGGGKSQGAEEGRKGAEKNKW